VVPPETTTTSAGIAMAMAAEGERSIGSQDILTASGVAEDARAGPGARPDAVGQERSPTSGRRSGAPIALRWRRAWA
jgi:hypothetical protein